MTITINNKEYKLDDLHITGNGADEREVTVASCADEDIIHVYTSDDVYLTRFKKLIAANPKWKIINIALRKDGTVSGVMLEAPKSALSFRTGLESTRAMSDEQRAASAERLRAARSKKSGASK